MLSSIHDDTGRSIRVFLLLIIFFDLVVAFAAISGLGGEYKNPSSHKWRFGGKSEPSLCCSHPRDIAMKTVSDTTSWSTSLVDFVEIVDDFGSKALVSEINGDDGNIFQFIRLEKEPDSQTLHDISSKERIIQKINQVRDEQKHYGRSDLYGREWESCHPNDEECNHDEIANSSSNARMITNKSITVMQFNTLAEGLSSGSSQCPFKDDKGLLDQRDPTGYGGFTSLQNPFITLDFERRKWRLVEVLFGTNLDTLYDVIAMEEVDRYRGFFRPLMNQFGYESIFVPKKNSPGVRMGWYSDGCVLAWKSCTFDLIHERSGDYTVGNQVYIIAALRHRVSQKYIVVAVTHLKAQQSDINEAVRCRQVDELLTAIDDEVMRLRNVTSDEQQAQIIILGDFNADPPSTTVDMNGSAIQKLLSWNNPTMGMTYRSAYTIDDPMNDMFTTWKIRGTKVSKRIIDYIFYAGSSLRCVATLKTIRSEDIEDSKLPGLRYPSDHLHIAAKFELL